jgi:hypothetical protein|tara:strand:+ start:164 stop:484 length:321 start_codon:yes stop_codon:yes gene_type:complete
MASTTTQLTPNSQTVTTMDGTTAKVAFQILPNAVAYWSPQVSTSFTTVTNNAPKGNDVVTFTEGLQVQMLPQTGGSYTVVVNGTITDSGSSYPIQSIVIGTFTPQA